MTTIGVSLAVPEPWGTELQRYRTGLGDADAALIPTHITLLPPIDVDEVLLPAIDDHLAKAAASCHPFLVRLRGTGTFRPISPVVFLNLVQGISCCEVLAAAVRTGPLAIEAAYPYHPHVTVAHHLDDTLMDRAFEELAHYDLEFDVDRFVLYHHLDDDGWVAQREYHLTATRGA